MPSKPHFFLLNSDKILSKIRLIKQELTFYQALAKDQRTPRLAKWLLAGAVIYLLMPFDIIPDFIPILGQLDDILLVPVLIWFSLKLIPFELKEEIRTQLII